jgi:hypothetical protein
LDLPHSLPPVHIRGIVLPERPKGLLKSLFGAFDLSICTSDSSPSFQAAHQRFLRRALTS